MYRQTPESITTRAAIDAALRAEARASRLALANALLRADVQRLTKSRDRWRFDALKTGALLLRALAWVRMP